MLSIFIPALNEEKTLFDSVQNIIKASRIAAVNPIEIIVVNDGSSDGTHDIIEQLKKEFDFIRSIEHAENKGIGSSFLEALHIAKYEKISIFPADNYSSLLLIVNLLKNIHAADFVISYTLNAESRGRLRNALSTIFNLIYMLTFDIHIKYINGSPIYPVKMLRALKLHSKKYSLFAEINVKLLRKGVSFFETEGEMNPSAVNSSALKIKNFIDIVKTYLSLIFEIYFTRRKEYSFRPVRLLRQDISLER